MIPEDKELKESVEFLNFTFDGVYLGTTMHHDTMYEVPPPGINDALTGKESEKWIPSAVSEVQGILESGFATQRDQKEFCLKLLESMYGNVDAALSFFKTYSAHITRAIMKMKQSLADPACFSSRTRLAKLCSLQYALSMTHCSLGQRKKWGGSKGESRKDSFTVTLASYESISGSGMKKKLMKMEKSIWRQQCQKWYRIS
jgi:hypothetical protein